MLLCNGKIALEKEKDNLEEDDAFARDCTLSASLLNMNLRDPPSSPFIGYIG
jgi:hypothetical protein